VAIPVTDAAPAQTCLATPDDLDGVNAAHVRDFLAVAIDVLSEPASPMHVSGLKCAKTLRVLSRP